MSHISHHDLLLVLLVSVVSSCRWSKHCMAMEQTPYGSTVFWILPLLWVGSAKPTPRTEFSKCPFQDIHVSVLISVCFFALCLKLNWLDWFSLLRSANMHNWLSMTHVSSNFKICKIVLQQHECQLSARCKVIISLWDRHEFCWLTV